MSPPNEKIMQHLDKFECRRCNACCEQPGFVYLKDGEAGAMAGLLGLELYSFTDKFTEVIDRRSLVLKKNENEACVFLTSGGCSVYSVRPGQCRDFPRGWRTERSFNYCQGLKALAK